MKVDYSFTTGEKTEIEVSEEWGTILLELDNQENNSERKETRRHASLNAMDYEGDIFADESADIISILENKELLAKLQKMISSLQPQQKELVKKVFFEGKTGTEIANEEGVSKAAISIRLKKIYKKLKKSDLGA